MLEAVAKVRYHIPKEKRDQRPCSSELKLSLRLKSSSMAPCASSDSRILGMGKFAGPALNAESRVPSRLTGFPSRVHREDNGIRFGFGSTGVPRSCLYQWQK